MSAFSKSRTIALGLTLASLLAAKAASAEPATGKALLEEGMKQMEAGDVAGACAKLEASQKIEPGMATEFRLAQCYEKLGKTATALRLYREVAEIAHQAKRADREDFARKSAEALAPRLATLSLVVPAAIASIPGLTILRNGERVDPRDFGAPVAVDPGEQLLRASAPGKKPWEARLGVKEGAKIDLSVPALEPAAAGAAEGAHTGEASPGGARKALLIGGIAGGAAALGLGAAFAALSQGKASASHALEKPGAGCAPTCEAQFDTLQKDRATFANVAVWSFLGAGAIGAGTLIGGLILPSSAGGKAAAKAELRVLPLGAGAALVGVW